MGNARRQCATSSRQFSDKMRHPLETLGLTDDRDAEAKILRRRRAVSETRRRMRSW